MSNASVRVGMPIFEADPSDEVRAYDLLDPRLREFVRQAPEQFSCIWLLKAQHEKGVESLLREGYALLRRRFPDWTPI